MKLHYTFDQIVFKAVSGKHVLTVGCVGETGRLSTQVQKIDELSASWQGIDINEKFIKENPQWQIHNINLNSDWKLDFPEVEVIILTEVLEHLENPVATLRRLKEQYPGRKLLASVPNAMSFGKILLSMINHPTYRKQDHAHLQIYNLGTIQNTFNTAGIEPFELSMYELHRAFFPVSWIFRNWATGFLIETTL